MDKTKVIEAFHLSKTYDRVLDNESDVRCEYGEDSDEYKEARQATKIAFENWEEAKEDLSEEEKDEMYKLICIHDNKKTYEEVQEELNELVKWFNQALRNKLDTENSISRCQKEEDLRRLKLRLASYNDEVATLLRRINNKINDIDSVIKMRETESRICGL